MYYGKVTISSLGSSHNLIYHLILLLVIFSVVQVRSSYVVWWHWCTSWGTDARIFRGHYHNRGSYVWCTTVGQCYSWREVKTIFSLLYSRKINRLLLLHGTGSIRWCLSWFWKKNAGQHMVWFTGHLPQILYFQKTWVCNKWEICSGDSVALCTHI